METSLRVGLPRMTAQLCRRLVDATDVRGQGCAVRAPGYDKVAVVGPRALQVVDHQVSPMRLDCRFKTLHRRQQVHERFGILGARHRDPAAPQPGRHLGRRRRTLLEFLVLVHADSSRLSIPRTCRPDNNTATAPPAPPRRPPDDGWRGRAWRHAGWASCRSTAWRRTAGTFAGGPSARRSSRTRRTPGAWRAARW